MNTVAKELSKPDIRRFTKVTQLKNESAINNLMQEILDNGTKLKSKNLYSGYPMSPVSSSQEAVKVLKNDGCIYTDQGIFLYSRDHADNSNYILKKEGLYFIETSIGVVSRSDIENAELITFKDNRKKCL